MTRTRSKPGRGAGPSRKGSFQAAAPEPLPIATAPWWHWWLAILTLIAATVVVYYPTLHNDFINWDDKDYIVNNKKLTEPGGLKKIWDPRVKQEQFYPMVFSSYWLEHRLELECRASQLGVAIADLTVEQRRFNPGVYHATNLVLHAINVALVVWLLRLLGLRPWVAWLTAGLFALHPINVASVSWASERKNVLSGLFYLLALIFYVRHARRTTWTNYAVCLALYVLALLSKTATLTLPATVMLCDRLILHRWRWRAAALVVPMIALGLAAAWMTHKVERANASRKATVLVLEPELRPFAAAGALWFYMGKIALPADYPGVYSRWEIPAHWAVFLAALLGLPASVVLIWKLRRRLSPYVVGGLGHYVLSLAPMLGLIPFNYTQFSFVADHFVYIPVIGVFVCVAIAAEFIRLRFSPGWLRIVPMTTLACAVLVALGSISWRHNQDVWKDGRTFWEYTVRLNPACWPGQYNLANIYSREAARLQKERKSGEVRPYREKAAKHYALAAQAKSGLYQAHRAGARELERLGRYDEAAECYRGALEALSEKSKYRTLRAQFLLRLGELLTQAGKHSESEREFQRCLEV
ncbi:MAG: hypothetical protein ACYSUQ_07950, partial [Planctomycetota bacterium]